MKKIAYAAALLLLIAGAYLAGSRQNRGQSTSPQAPAARKILYYVHPMHPAYRSDKPGIAPDCGMQLEPVYADGGPAAAADAAGHTSSPRPGSVPLDASKQQLIGIQVSPVEKVSGSHNLRLFGRVVPDEGRVYRVNAGADGSIRDVSALTTGSHVEKDQWLASCFMPDSRVPLQAYLTALDVVDRDRRPEPRLDPRGRFRERRAVPPPRRESAGHSSGTGEDPHRPGRRSPAPVRRGHANSEGAARGGQSGQRPAPGDVRGREAVRRLPTDDRRSDGIDPRFRAQEDGVRRTRPGRLRTPAGRDRLALRRPGRDRQGPRARRAHRGLGHVLSRLGEPDEAGGRRRQGRATAVIDRIIEFSARNKGIVFFLTAAAALAGWNFEMRGERPAENP